MRDVESVEQRDEQWYVRFRERQDLEARPSYRAWADEIADTVVAGARASIGQAPHGSGVVYMVRIPVGEISREGRARKAARNIRDRIRRAGML